MNIAFDFDDTLVDFVPAFCEWHNKVYGTAVKHNTFEKETIEGYLNCTSTEMLTRSREFLITPAGQYLPPIIRVERLLIHYHKAGYKCFVITARSTELKESTLTNIMALGLTPFIQEVVFTDGKPKAQACLKYDISMLIDDYTKNLEQCRLCGIKGVLVNHARNQRYWEDQRFEHI